jgi:hypothetical protein
MAPPPATAALFGSKPSAPAAPPTNVAESVNEFDSMNGSEGAKLSDGLNDDDRNEGLA